MAEGEPTYRPEGFDRTYQGMDFAVFSSLEDAEVEALRAAHNEAVRLTPLLTEDEGGLTISDEGGRLFDEGTVLGNFMRWRRYGVPDREVTQADVEAYLRELITARQAADSRYGALPVSMAEWSHEELLGLRYLYDYLHQMRNHTEPLTVDSYSLIETIGFIKEDIDLFVERGVLAHTGEYTAPDAETYETFILQSPYYDHLLVYWYGKPRSAATEENA